MVDVNGPVNLVNGHFKLLAHEPDRLLQEALAAAAGGPTALRGKGVSLPITDAHERDFILHMMPLDSKQRATLGADRATTFLIFIRRLDDTGAVAITAFAERFALTKQESRVLRAVIDTGSVPMAADILGISPTTTRFHVTSIFDKTGVRTQPGLIRLLIETVSPFKAG